MPRSKGSRHRRGRDPRPKAGSHPQQGNGRILQNAIFEVVENQLRDRDPPETRATYDRLLRQVYTDKEAMKLIGCVASSEIFDIMQEDRPFNLPRYIAMLDALPKLPWDEE